MKELVWDQTLSVENDEIDNDHRILVDLLNLLGHSVGTREAPEYIEAVLEELIRCTAWHFSHEERLMLKSAYGELEEHQQEHQELMEGVREMQREILLTGELEEKELERLEHWLTGHILVADMKFGEFLIGAA